MDQAERSDHAEAAAMAQRMSPEQLARGLYSFNKRTARLSALALKKCGPRAVKPLLEAYYRVHTETGLRTRRHNLAMGTLACAVSLICFIAIAAILPNTAPWEYVAPVLSACIFPSILQRYFFSHDSRPAPKALCELDDKRVLGALIDSLTRPSLRKPDVRNALAKLLPRVTESDRNLVTPFGLRALMQMMSPRSGPLTMGIIHAIEVLGDGSFAAELCRIVDTLRGQRGDDSRPELLTAAQRCLAVEQARAAERLAANTLLRPTDARDESALLRPAPSRPADDHATLGRPADMPQELPLDRRG